MLTAFIENIDENASNFLLPTPSEGDSNGIKIKIYLFSKPQMLEIHIFKKTLVQDVIRHVITLYKNNKAFSEE